MGALHSFLVVGSVLLTLAGCRHAANPFAAEETGFEAEWKRYVALPQFKAMAVAGDTNGVYVSGTSHGRSSWQEAIAEAYALCEKRRTERGISTPCRPHAIGEPQTGRGE